MIEARKLIELYNRVDLFLRMPLIINRRLLERAMTDIEDFLEASGYYCPECGEYRPDDDRVLEGMRCGHCVYGGGE